MFSDDYYDTAEELYPDKLHPPLSPARGAESLFLAGLATSNISANALASKLRQSHSGSASSAQSDDFGTCAQNSDDLFLLSLSSDDDKNIPDLDSDSDTESISTNTNTTMSTKVSIDNTSKATKMPKKVDPKASTTAASTGEEHHMDPATNVYEKAKGVWAWGKGVPVISFGLGIAEAVAGKAVSVAGSSLEDIDSKMITPQLTKLDTGVLNPTIESIVAMVLKAAGKTEDMIGPIIKTMLAPFGLIKNEAENPELTAK
jgi:hypothetical protein